MWKTLWNLVNTILAIQNNTALLINDTVLLSDRDSATSKIPPTIPVNDMAAFLMPTKDSTSKEKNVNDMAAFPMQTKDSTSQEKNEIPKKAVERNGDNCPPPLKFGNGPPANSCQKPTDPKNLPASPAEKWLTREVFDDLFPKANLGHGPHGCLPYSYDAFQIALRYFPEFGTESPNKNYSQFENTRRDAAAFFAHAVQETGENDISLYESQASKAQADACFYRGGFYNWFEGGPTTQFLDPPDKPGYTPSDGERCRFNGIYCASSTELDYWYPCVNSSEPGDDGLYSGCYFGRGAIQLSYNYNYGQFEWWLRDQGIETDLLSNPNLLITRMDPPLAMLASMWFYMTPQPPKPAMHDIVMGSWNSGDENRRKGYFGPIFGPTSLVINNECNGEDAEDPGGPGESRRIKAFKWFCAYFQVPPGPDDQLTCKGMPKKLDELSYPLSYQPDWANTWREEPCDCKPATYGGMLPYFHPDYYPARFVESNSQYQLSCVYSVYDNPQMYNMNSQTSPCLNHTVPFDINRYGHVID